MDSEGNKFCDGTGFQPSEPKLCANGCGFFGTATTMNLCSKCYRDLRINEEQAASTKATMKKLMNQNQNQNQNQTGFSAESHVGSSSEAAAESSAAVEPTAGVESAGQQVETKVANRCLSCKKRVRMMGFRCRCGDTFCGTHRYPEKHDCTFDFKAVGRDAISKANPMVKADKVVRL